MKKISKNSKYPTSWMTRHEKEYIKKLGSHSDAHLSKKEHLLNYLKTAKNRIDWDHMNRKEIVAFAKQELEKYRI